MDNAAEKGASVKLSTVVGEAEKEGSKCKKKKFLFSFHTPFWQSNFPETKAERRLSRIGLYKQG